jgi:predicted ATPase
MPLIATEGYAAPDVGNVYLKARKLCQQLGDAPEISQVLWGLWTFHVLRAELGDALQIAEEFLRLSERLPYPGLKMRAHLAMEISFTHQGEYAPAIEHYEKALLLFDPEQHRDDAFLYSLDPGVAMRCFASWSLWFLGQPDQALARIQEALTLAKELSEPHGIAHSLFFAAIVHQLRREARMSQEYAEAAIAVAVDHGFVMYQALAEMTRGWALAEQGRAEEAIEPIRQGLAAHLGTGARLRSQFLALLAEALKKAGRTEEARAILEEALDAANHTGERSYQAELFRLKGELLLKESALRGASRAAGGGKVVSVAIPSAIADAEACFNESIRIAQRQQAKSLELRAVVSLARHYQQQEKPEKALALLSPVYRGFNEGFDTIDLREANALLEELS